MNELTLTSIANTFSPEYRTFVQGDFPDAIAQKLGQAQQLDDIGILIVRNGILLYLHFVLLEAELATFMVTEGDIPEASANQIVVEFLKELPTAYVEQHDTVATEMRTPPVESEVPKPPTPPEAEGVRTMADDINKAQDDSTPATSQDDLLRR